MDNSDFKIASDVYFRALHVHGIVWLRAMENIIYADKKDATIMSVLTCKKQAE